MLFRYFFINKIVSAPLLVYLNLINTTYILNIELKNG